MDFKKVRGSSIFFTVVLFFLISSSILGFDKIVQWIFPTMPGDSYLDKNLRLETLKILIIVTGGWLLIWQILLTNKRTKASEELSKAAAENAKAAIKSSENTFKNIQVLEQGQVQERFKNAIDQLGSDKQPVVLGAIYTLHHVAKDSETLRKSVFDILCSYIRETTSTEDYKKLEKPSIRIQSILNLLFVDEKEREIYNGFRADLDGSWLIAANLSEANLSKATLTWADLSRAKLSGAKLSGANLTWADLTGADLSRAKLSGTYLSGATLSRADLSGADFSKAKLSRADLSEAYLSEAILSGADLSGADFSKVDLSKAKLSGAQVDTLNWLIFLKKNNCTGINDIEKKYIVKEMIVDNNIVYYLQSIE